MKLLPEPDWHGAARELVRGFAALDALDERIRVMDKLCERLGGSLYPAFLQVLCVVERNGDAAARRLVVDTLIRALGSGRLPAGRVPAWGASRSAGTTAFASERSLGPIEYLCAWYGQPSELPGLAPRAFTEMGVRLLGLIGEDPAAREMYCATLVGEADDPLGGSLARETRAGLRALAETWRATGDADASLAAYVEALVGAGEDRLGRIEANPFF